MLEFKLWDNKTEPKNAEVTKMMEFIKTCDQHPSKFNFGYFFSSIILPSFFWGKQIFKKKLFVGSG